MLHSSKPLPGGLLKATPPMARGVLTTPGSPQGAQSLLAGLLDMAVMAAVVMKKMTTTQSCKQRWLLVWLSNLKTGHPTLPAWLVWLLVRMSALYLCRQTPGDHSEFSELELVLDLDLTHADATYEPRV